MAVIDTPQRVVLSYEGRRYWFAVWRYNSISELHADLIKDSVRDFDKGTAAYTACYGQPDQKGEECGRMYLLDKSIATLAQQASAMAFHLGHRAGVVDDWEDVISNLTGQITSDLYSKSKFF